MICVFGSKEWIKFLNRTERSVKKLDAMDILLILFSGLSLGTVFTSLSKRVMKTLAPFIAVFGVISSAFIVVKLFFSEDEDVPYVKIHKEKTSN